MSRRVRTVCLASVCVVRLAVASGSAARGESPAAFDRRCVPAACVSSRSHTAGMLPRRALSSRRIASLGATRGFPHGLLAFQPDIERENLTGLREVNVVVEDLAEDAEAAGLTRRALLTAVEQQLETRGVPQGSSRQGADLYINVSTHQGATGLFAYYARVSVQQLATIEGNQLRSLVDTWARASLGAVGGGNLPQVEQVVMQLVDLFCDDYFEVNDRVR